MNLNYRPIRLLQLQVRSHATRNRALAIVHLIDGAFKDRLSRLVVFRYRHQKFFERQRGRGSAMPQESTTERARISYRPPFHRSVNLGPGYGKSMALCVPLACDSRHIETKVIYLQSTCRQPWSRQDHRQAKSRVYFGDGGGAISAMRGSCRMLENSSSL